MITSVRSKYDCGSIGPELRKTIDFTQKSGMSYLETRPLNPTGISNSPYQCLSSCAHNHYLISLDDLKEDGLLTEEECRQEEAPTGDRVDYGRLYERRVPVLRIAYRRFSERGGLKTDDYRAFAAENEDWLKDYAPFMGLKAIFNGAAWNTWPPPYRKRNSPAVRRWENANRREIEFWRFTQYMFFRQWKALHEYARAQGVQIIGDIPYYVSFDSCDVWAEPELFMIDRQGMPILSGGVPGDGNNDAVRNWGSPAFVWEAHLKDGLKWWKRRTWVACQLYDGIRLDHVIGFVRWYGIPRDERKARWYDGPDAHEPVVLKMIQEEARKSDAFVIAEDLGVIPPGLRESMDELGILGTRVLQFAFTGKYRYESNHLPIYHKKNLALYTGNHDLPTMKEYLDALSPGQREYMKWWFQTDEEGLRWGMIREAYKSVADIALVPIQDILGAGRESRLVDPECWQNSWRWRLNSEEIASRDVIDRLRSMAILSGRCPLGSEEKQAAFDWALKEGEYRK